MEDRFSDAFECKRNIYSLPEEMAGSKLTPMFCLLPRAILGMFLRYKRRIRDVAPKRQFDPMVPGKLGGFEPVGD